MGNLVCSAFGCGRTLSNRESLCGTLCIIHQNDIATTAHFKTVLEPSALSKQLLKLLQNKGDNEGRARLEQLIFKLTNKPEEKSFNFTNHKE